MRGFSPVLAALVLLLAPFVHGSPVDSGRKIDLDVANSRRASSPKFVNKGLVGFGFIPSDAKDSTGDTIGGIGSAIALQRGSFKQTSNGTFNGTLVVQPDRGYNVVTTINYQARQHLIDFVLTPYTESSKLSFSDAQRTFVPTYRSTLLYEDRGNVPTSGLDALAVRPAANGDPQVPIPSLSLNHLSVDAEGLVLNADGTYWTSDEYGPYIYRFSSTGNLLQTIQPPTAILPYINNALNFTGSVDPTTGRASNQGFEGLTASPDGSTIYALLQSATIQDGGSDKSTSRYTRLLAYSVSGTPTLTGEWIVPLPQNSKGNTLASSELHYLSSTSFLILSRDSDGQGGSDTSSSYKQIDLLDLSSATDIHGTAYDTPGTPVAPKGKLAKGVTAAKYTSFVDLIDDDELARFGLHNGGDAGDTLIDAKWESLALAPALDPSNPNDYFLFTAADNDFLSTDGVALGQPYDAGTDVDSQFLVWLGDFAHCRAR